jgi:hypothetical protein
VAAAGAILAWLTIRSDVLHPPARRREHYYSHCALEGPPLRASDGDAPALVPAGPGPE